MESLPQLTDFQDWCNTGFLRSSLRPGSWKSPNQREEQTLSCWCHLSSLGEFDPGKKDKGAISRPQLLPENTSFPVANASCLVSLKLLRFGEKAKVQHHWVASMCAMLIMPAILKTLSFKCVTRIHKAYHSDYL